MLSVNSRLIAYVERQLDGTVTASRTLAIARSVIAVAQVSVLIFTDWRALFVPVSGQPFGPQCDGQAALSIYCFGGGAISPRVATVIVALILVGVIVGYFPRWFAPLHYWATLSISASITLPDGGEAIAKIVVLLLVVITLSDARRNHWHQHVRQTASLVPLSWAAWQILRIQMVWVYANAAISKTSVAEWVEGSAIYYVARDPLFGVGGPAAEPYLWATAQPVLALSMAWGAIAVELLIAVLLIQGPRIRRYALVLALILHGSFIVTIGLWSFALIMIGAVLAAIGPYPHRQVHRGMTRSLQSRPLDQSLEMKSHA